MGRKPVSNKKTPSEYPLFSFRTTDEKKARLGALVEQVQGVLNKRRKEDDPFVNKNDVIVMALEIGLASLKKR